MRHGAAMSPRRREARNAATHTHARTRRLPSHGSYTDAALLACESHDSSHAVAVIRQSTLRRSFRRGDFPLRLYKIDTQTAPTAFHRHCHRARLCSRHSATTAPINALRCTKTTRCHCRITAYSVSQKSRAIVRLPRCKRVKRSGNLTARHSCVTLYTL